MTTTRTARWTARVAVLAAATAVVAACGPVAPVTEPEPPVISSFSVVGGVGPAPAVVALSWYVYDRNADVLLCELDADGDGTYETTIAPCSGTASRNVTLPAGSTTARLRVDDGQFTVEATTAIQVAAPVNPEPFDIELRGLDALSGPARAAFDDAAARWESVLVAGKADVALDPGDSCWYEGEPLVSPIDDLVIDVAVVAIDGPGGTLGQAGPCLYDTATELAIYGAMEFDSADVAAMISDGSFTDVVLHEMGHVLGIGTLWDTTQYSSSGQRQLLQGGGTLLPQFIGARASVEWSSFGRFGGVPVESSGGPGTRDAHWSEATFDNELMTGWISGASNPMSRITIASLADLGYQVDLGAADAYVLPGTAALRAAGPSHIEDLEHPAPSPAS